MVDAENGSRFPEKSMLRAAQQDARRAPRSGEGGGDTLSIHPRETTRNTENASTQSLEGPPYQSIPSSGKANQSKSDDKWAWQWAWQSVPFYEQHHPKENNADDCQRLRFCFQVVRALVGGVSSPHFQAFFVVLVYLLSNFFQLDWEKVDL
ncbi:expressed unknown protein [Seminavis robusta]|uniref:Uncharacterized protein n=1 Tax=Seminavis robusta TaxID=568900 RepID=A0A9N8F4G2_9STRA|nr:expressed unknown protein [Seminavis robusta]|eukprot:Sro3598_g349510.1 n/a (151) ;mRNA; f:3806-4258